MIARDTDNSFITKQENITINGETSSKVLASSTTSWTRLKDPRVVRVSRALGGKDRHSKVCTVRGLRDRRVRLSVPTAIQLYDLQDRLGLSQPSKVVDWLLNAAKNEIDELPPLQMPPGVSFSNIMSPNLNSINMLSSSATSNSHDHNPIMKSKGEITSSSDGINHQEISNWARSGASHDDNDHDSLSRQNTSHPLISSLLMSGGNSMPFVRWDPSNLTLHHPPISLGLMAAHDQRSDQHHDNDQDHSLQSFSQQIPYSSSQHHHQQQVLVYQPYNFPLEFDTKQTNFQGLELLGNSSTQLSDDRPFHFGMSSTATANLLPPQNSSTDSIEDQGRRN